MSNPTQIRGESPEYSTETKLKPLADHGHYTAVHDAVFDVVMPFCPPNAFKVLMLVLRKTRGWKKEEDVLRYEEIKAGTGIKSNTTLAKELDWLVGKKLLLVREEDGGERVEGSRKAPAYSLNRDFELSVAATENGVRPKRPSPENEPKPSPETGPSNKQSTEEPTEENFTNVQFSSATDKKPAVSDGSPSRKISKGQKGKLDGVSFGQYAVSFLVDVLKAAKEQGAAPPPLTSRQRGEYGEFFAQAMRDGESVEDGEMTLRWLVAKACGNVESEPEAWAYFGTAQRAVRDGWQPKRALRLVLDPEAQKKNDDEWDEILREQQEMIREAMGG